MAEVVLEVQDLKKHFHVTRGLVLQRVIGWVRAVDGVSFNIAKGETLSLVGESGAGKTTTARIILLLERMTSGSLLFKGKDIRGLSRSQLKEYRSAVQAVFQDPWSSLDPRMQVRSIVAEPLVVNTSMSRKQISVRVHELLEQVGLRSDHAQLYPHEFSGGQRQRIAVARALALNPSLIVLDEPVSALDVSIRAQIMNLLKDLQSLHGVSYLLIAHNLATVRYMSQHVAVMYLGKIVEYAEAEELFSNPLHPYTRALISAGLPVHPGDSPAEIILSGEMPSPLNPPSGCHFHPRCTEAMPICSEVEPMLRDVVSSHTVRCHLH